MQRQEHILHFGTLSFYVKKRTKSPLQKLPFKRNDTPCKALIGLRREQLHVGKITFLTPFRPRKALPALLQRKNR